LVLFSYEILQELLARIQKCNNHLKKYSNVNKKALDQFVNFSDRRETLLSRHEELMRGEEAIKGLIEVSVVCSYFNYHSF
jgi:structural maintenance of chromosome 3 (chondroitin sulfate proteoglycan 6)